MTTLPSSPRSHEAVIPFGAAEAPPSVGTAATTGAHRPDPPPTRPRTVDGASPADTAPPHDPVTAVDLVDPAVDRAPLTPPHPARPGSPAAARTYRDPVSDLVHAAVADRPLEEVVDLISALERSPQHTKAVVDALRSAGIDRSVEDVTRLVALLTRAPRDIGSADETIRAAAEHRSVEDVTLLVALLQNEPLAPHCRDEALRAAATGRSVDDLVELIDRLALHQPPEHLRPAAEASGTGDRTQGRGGADAKRRSGSAPAPAPRSRARFGRRRSAARDGARPTRRSRRRPGTPAPERSSRPVAKPVLWSSWLVAVALAVCAVAHFPLRQDGVPVRLHAMAVGLSVLCTMLALILVVRPGAVALAGAVVVPTVLAAAHAYGGSLPTAPLPRAVALALAPAWVAASAALAAALLALTALVVRVSFPPPGTRWNSWQPSEFHQVAD